MNAKYKGIFVTFEGLDFSGKTTQAKLLESYIKSLGVNVVMHKEPGGTLIGGKIREILLDRDSIDMFPETELMLFNAARLQYVSELLFLRSKEEIFFCPIDFMIQQLHIKDMEEVYL